MKELLEINEKEAEKIINIANGNIELIKEKYELARSQGNIKNKVAWIIDAIKNNYQEPKPVRNRLIDYEGQRKYNANDLEKLLVNKWQE